MDELSLYVLDITMNSVRAGATLISIELIEQGAWLDFTVRDNGCGMTEESRRVWRPRSVVSVVTATPSIG